MRCVARLAIAAAWLGGLCLSPSAMADLDLRGLWNFADPAASEQRFHERARDATPDEQAILQTQIARTLGLRRRFDEARAVLAALEPRLAERSPEVQARHHLELGRTWASATHRPAERDAAARARARAAFVQAHAVAAAAGLDDLAIDALHMLPFTTTDPAEAARLNETALAAALASPQPAARRWEASLRNNLGVSLHEQGRLDDALAVFRANVEPTARLGDAMRLRIAHWMVAWTLRGLGRGDEALAIQLRLAAENAAAGTPDPEVYGELALLHAARGDAERAAAYERLKTEAEQPRR